MRNNKDYIIIEDNTTTKESGSWVEETEGTRYLYNKKTGRVIFEKVYIHDSHGKKRDNTSREELSLGKIPDRIRAKIREIFPKG